MALPVAQLPNMPSLNLGGGQRQQQPQRLRDVILAKIASDVLGEVVGQTVGNVMTHATGGDMTGQAVDQGLIAEDTRNPVQRWLGNQMTEQEFRQLSLDKQNKEQQDIENTLKAEELIQRMNAQTAAQGQAQQENLLRQDQINAGLLGNLATMRRDNAEMRQRSPLIVAQTRGALAGAESTELANQQVKDMRFEQLLNQLAGQFPQEGSEASQAMLLARLREYLQETGDTDPTRGEVAEWMKARYPQTPEETAETPRTPVARPGDVVPFAGGTTQVRPGIIESVGSSLQNFLGSAPTRTNVDRLNDALTAVVATPHWTAGGYSEDVAKFQQLYDQATPEDRAVIEQRLAKLREGGYLP